MSRLVFVIWIVVSLGWILAIGSFAYNSWPYMPLDISHSDPGTRAAYDQAVFIHAAKHAAIALFPPLVTLALVRWIIRRVS